VAPRRDDVPRRRIAMSYCPIIVPYLAVSDADAAIAFYKRAFGAEEKMRVPGENRGVMHA
jgi:PhnB protein